MSECTGKGCGNRGNRRVLDGVNIMVRVRFRVREWELGVGSRERGYGSEELELEWVGG